MAIFHVVLTQSGPQWDPAQPLESQSRWSDHAGFMEGLVDDGFLLLGGPLAGGPRVAHVVEAESPDAVRSTLADDPWHGTHLEIEAIDPWTIRLDGLRGGIRSPGE